MGEPEFTIDNADQYPEILRERGKSSADYEERKAKIKADAEEAARKIGGNADLSESCWKKWLRWWSGRSF